MANQEEIKLTKEGIEKFQQELRHLIDVERPKVTREIKEAKEQGDLSENSDYDAARTRQSEIEARIAYLQNALIHATEIKATDSSVVGLGSTVVVRMLDINIEETYKIVGPAEADPENGKISNACVLATAIMGHKAGERVHVKASEPYDVEIVKIGK